MTLSIKSCYSGDGRTVKMDFPCDPNAEVSACCGAGSVCVENFYCRDSGGNNIAGTCTDQLFGINYVPTPACPCRTFFKNDNSTLNWNDGATVCPDGSVCCGANNFECCDAGKGNPRIRFQNSNVIPSSTASLSAYYAALVVSTVSVSSRTKTTSGTVSAATATGVSVSASLSAALTSGSTASVSQSTAGTTSSTDTLSLSSGAKIGIGLGVGLTSLVLLLILAFAIAIWRRYSKIRLMASIGSTTSRTGDWSPTTMGRHEAPVQYINSPYQPSTPRKSWFRNSKPVELSTERKAELPADRNFM